MSRGVSDRARRRAALAFLTVACLAPLPAARGAVRGGSPFELRTAFPARTLADEAQTLAAAGLAPAATLCMRPLP